MGVMVKFAHGTRVGFVCRWHYYIVLPVSNEEDRVFRNSDMDAINEYKFIQNAKSTILPRTKNTFLPNRI